MRRKLIVANWKSNPESWREAKAILAPLKRTIKNLTKVEAIICPPAIFLPDSFTLISKTQRLSLGAQDAFWEPTGPYTGQVSAAMLRKAGAKYVILGHSERRALGENNGQTNLKIKAALKEGLRVIFCVGEKERDQHGFYLKTLKQQLEDGLKGIPRKWLADLVVAYEPVWSVGAKARRVDTPADFVEQAIFIKKVASGFIGNEAARKLPVLYGGSVSPKNASGFLSVGEADGLLVGRASLCADKFSDILRQANEAKSL
ncbi:MAG: triose-phosphate isomerase [Patescibacteria group bacterium]|nr:triose-phosphate isomerase [Patescibacteria group bacterium]